MTFRDSVVLFLRFTAFYWIYVVFKPRNPPKYLLSPVFEKIKLHMILVISRASAIYSSFQHCNCFQRIVSVWEFEMMFKIKVKFEHHEFHWSQDCMMTSLMQYTHKNLNCILLRVSSRNNKTGDNNSLNMWFDAKTISCI